LAVADRFSVCFFFAVRFLDILLWRSRDDQDYVRERLALCRQT